MGPLVWLITGCSSGLGESFVQEALARGNRVIATARYGISRLEHLADLGAHTLDLDVTASQEELDCKVEEAVSEVAYFGIRVTIFDVGNVNTPILNPGRLKYSPRSVDNYDGLMNRFHEIIDYLDDQQPGDPKKAVKVTADVIKGEGVVAGKFPPERLLIGSDMPVYVQNKCEETLVSCREWDAVIHSINFDGLAPPEQSQASVVSSKLAQ